MSPVLAGSTFIRPHINLGYEPDRPGGVESLPELIEFASQKNPDHIFGVQHRASENASPYDMTFSQLQSAVEEASAWLVHSGLTPGRTRREDKIPPVGIFLGSDITIFIYMAALLRIGTPVSNAYLFHAFKGLIIRRSFYSQLVLRRSLSLTCSTRRHPHVCSPAPKYHTPPRRLSPCWKRKLTARPFPDLWTLWDTKSSSILTPLNKH